jgi:hypothetical protein
MNKENQFLVYCIEEYKYAKNMTGSEVWKLFEQKDVISYILRYYESLHVTSPQNIIADIDEYMQAA